MNGNSHQTPTLADKIDLRSAKGAAYSLPAWGSAPGLIRRKRARAESAIHSQGEVRSDARLIRGFSACLQGNADSWGAAPGYREIAPLALKPYGRISCRTHTQAGLPASH
jgi:hypothetical protein